MADGIENGGVPAVPPAPVGGQAAPAPEPLDIAQAFQMVRQHDQAPAQPAEPAGQADQGAVPAAEPAGGSEGQQPAVEPQPAAVPADAGVPAGAEQPEGPGDAGGAAAGLQGADYDSAQKELMQAALARAQQQVAERFRNDNILIFDIGKLYNRAEDGTVSFTNPDDPHHPFTSRAEAQQWIDSMNSQIRTAYQEEVRKEQQRIMQTLQPSMQMLQFAPVYDAMPDDVREVFDELIDPYAVNDSNGNPIGFNCNLVTMAKQAVKIAQRYRPAQQQQQQEQPVQQAAEPAMDIKASPSGTGTAEPRDINEAMRMLNEQRRKK